MNSDYTVDFCFVVIEIVCKKLTALFQLLYALI